MKAVVIILSVIIFSACLIIGIQAGSTGLTPAPEVDPTPAEPVSIAGQRTYIITAVDDLSSTTPRLVSTWAVFFRPGYSQLSALALYPRPGNPAVSGSADLPASFSLTGDKALSPEFLATLQTFHFTWDGTILIDHAGTRILIDWLGGVNLGEEHLDGTTAVNRLADPWNDPFSAAAGQKDLASGLCTAAAQSGTAIDWLGLRAALFPEHLLTAVEMDVLQSEFTGLITSDRSIICDFPELQG